MKLKGLKAGAPDLCLPLKRLAWGALYIEMKKPQGPKPRGKQLEAREMLTSQGQLVVSCQGSEKAKEIITMYLQATQEQILRYIGQNPEIKSGEARDMSGHAVKELPGRRLHEKVL
jgi:hypothetical protein